MRFCVRRHQRRKTAGGGRTWNRLSRHHFENARSFGRRRASSGNGAARAGQVRGALPLRLGRGLAIASKSEGPRIESYGARSGRFWGNGALNRFERPSAEFDLFAFVPFPRGKDPVEPDSGRRE